MMFTLFVSIIPLFTSEVIGVDQKTGEVANDSKPFVNFSFAGGFTVLISLIMLDICVGAVTFIYSAYDYEPAEKMRLHKGELPLVMPTVAFTF